MEVVVTTGAIKVVQSSSQIIAANKPTPSFLQAGCPSCRQTNSLKALKGKSVKVLKKYNLCLLICIAVNLWEALLSTSAIFANRYYGILTTRCLRKVVPFCGNYRISDLLFETRGISLFGNSFIYIATYFLLFL